MGLKLLENLVVRMLLLTACVAAMASVASVQKVDAAKGQDSKQLVSDASNETKKPAVQTYPIVLRVAKKGWKANPQTVEKLLYSVSRELWAYFPGHKLPVIDVRRNNGSPIVFFRRGPNGEVQMRLNAGETYWAQYSFQFAHELCHVLCRYDPDDHGNDWFEESLCELASLFVLRRMGETWKTDPPYKHWKSFAKHLTSYAQKRIDATVIADGKTFKQWYKDNEKSLHGTATDRPRNAIVALELLPLFEATPKHWEAVRWLNAAKPTKRQSLQEFLQDWKKHAPKRHRAFIDKIAAKFDITLK